MSMWKIGLPLLVLAISVGGAALLIASKEPVESQTPPPALRAVRTVTVERSPYQHTVVTHGTVEPRTETRLVAEVTGRVLEVHEHFERGGFVKEGDLLLRIDPSTYEATVAQAEASLAQAQSRLQREEAEAALAKEEWKRYGSGKANPLVLREPQVAAAQADVKFAEAQLRRAKLDLERVDVQAPYTGRIRERSVDHGQYVMAGTAVAVIYGTDTAEVRLPISADEIGYLDLPLGSATGPGATAAVRLEASVGGVTAAWHGSIARTEAVVDTKTRMVHAVARIEDPYQRRHASAAAPLLVGQFVKATIQGRALENAVVLPRLALQANDTVLVVTPDNAIEIRNIEIVRRGRDEVVVGSGLESGERVCVSDLDVVVDGMTVRVLGQGGA